MNLVVNDAEVQFPALSLPYMPYRFEDSSMGILKPESWGKQ